jgi:hypothetical protein
MGMQTISDFSDRAVSLIPNYMLKNKAGAVSYFTQEMMAFGDQVQALETAIMAIYLCRGIDAAVEYEYSQTLDDIGSIVGCPPHIVDGSATMSDGDYALALRAQIQMNASQGEPERLISAIQFLTAPAGDTPSKIDFVAYQPASVCLNVDNPEVIPIYLQQVMDKVKAAGVALTVQISTDHMFCFSLDGFTPWYTGGKGFRPTSASSDGGQLASPIFME